MASTEGDSSASRIQVLLSQPPIQNSCQLTTQVTGSQAGGHLTPTFQCSLHRLTFNWQLATELSHSPTSYFTSLHSTALLTTSSRQKSQSQSHIVTDGQSVSKSWCRASWPDIYYCLTVTVLFLWGALSDERTGLSFVYAAGPCQRSLSWVRVPWDFRPYITVTDLRLPFSSPPTTRRVTVEVFDPSFSQIYYSSFLPPEFSWPCL
jgi:hypothetical protein